MPRIWLLVAACAYVMVSTKAFSPSPLRIPSHLRFGAKRSSRTPLQAGLFGIGGKKKVGVIGATGGVGRLAIAYLLQQGCEVRAIVRNKNLAAELLPADIELKLGDTRDPAFGDGLTSAIAGVDALIVATGTTAFPTDKWGPNRENSPQAVDDQGVKNVVEAISEVNGKRGKKMKKIALLSSIGVERRKEFPFSLLNVYGVLDAKYAGELAVKAGAERAGYSYALARLGRLVGGPYTGTPDVASLLQLDEGSNQAITMAKGDPQGFAGDLSRKQAAMTLVQSLLNSRDNFAYAIVNKPGDEPTQEEWDKAFESLDMDFVPEQKDFSFLVKNLVTKATKVYDDVTDAMTTKYGEAAQNLKNQYGERLDTEIESQDIMVDSESEVEVSNNIVPLDAEKTTARASSKIVNFSKRLLSKVGSKMKALRTANAKGLSKDN